jgi:hypothetical protein
MPRAAADHQHITGALDGVHTSGILGLNISRIAMGTMSFAEVG